MCHGYHYPDQFDFGFTWSLVLEILNGAIRQSGSKIEKSHLLMFGWISYHQISCNIDLEGRIKGMRRYQATSDNMVILLVLHTSIGKHELHAQFLNRWCRPIYALFFPLLILNNIFHMWKSKLQMMQNWSWWLAGAEPGFHLGGAKTWINFYFTNYYNYHIFKFSFDIVVSSSMKNILRFKTKFYMKIKTSIYSALTKYKQRKVVK